MTTPVSGSYRGFRTAPAGATQRLDLRVDVDGRIEQGQVLNRVSGDVFRVEKVIRPGRPPKETEIYQESWILENPAVKLAADATLITGVVRYWDGVRPKTTATIRIPFEPAGAAAEVMLARQASPPEAYSCSPNGIFFRALHLEVDVCKSVNREPVLPSYDTHSLSQRPPNTPARVLTVERTYGEAGVQMVIRGDKRNVIDDSLPKFGHWTDAELHNAMERHFSQNAGPWPQWELWGLLAGSYEDDLVGGIMFDYAAADSGPARSSERQGFAVFRNHFWFDHLVPNPTTTEELESARRFVWTFTHEAGHAFNLLHSFDKQRPDALSWMNYVDNYDEIHGDGAYWRSFPFRFDDDELLHIRHGNRSSVIMGGDPWGSGGHAESPPGAEAMQMPPGAMTSVGGDVPIELLVRSQEYYEFLEPVSIEIRARNLTEVPVRISQSLHPELGSVSIYVRRPDGRIVEYLPISCKLAEDRSVTLSAAGAADESDRHSRTIFVSYGRYGFYFDEPGQYSVRAVYHGPGNMLVPSNVQRMRVGYPASRESDRLAQDFFSYQSGAALYLGGSHSDFLAKGMGTLQTAIHSGKGTLAAAKTAARIAYGVGQPFHDITADCVRCTTEGDVKDALQLTGLAMKTFHEQPSKDLNLTIERVIRARSGLLQRMGNPEQARAEMMALAGDLDRGGVKPGVVAKVAYDAGLIEVAKAKAKRRPRKPAK
jgi:hypothetical protein